MKNAIPVMIMIVIFLFASGIGVVIIRQSLPSELPIRVIITSIPERYNDKALLLQDFQKDLISLDEVIQILLLDADEGMFLPFFDADTYYDQYYIHKKTYVERKTK